MGQYAYGNQPVQHAIYLYNWLGKPWKTQKRVREVMDKLYSSAPDSLCGDEDNGQTSAWYVFSAMGFYPVAPGTGQYAIGSPLFKNVKLHLQNGNIFEMNVPNNSKENVYIHKISKNKSTHTKNYITFKDLMDGASFSLEMSNQPNTKLRTRKESRPYSMSQENK